MRLIEVALTLLLISYAAYSPFYDVPIYAFDKGLDVFLFICFIIQVIGVFEHINCNVRNKHIILSIFDKTLHIIIYKLYGVFYLEKQYGSANDKITLPKNTQLEMIKFFLKASAENSVENYTEQQQTSPNQKAKDF